MTRKLPPVAGLLAALMMACLTSPVAAEWVDGQGNSVEESTVVSAVVGSTYVLLGEIHDNPAHHVMQARLLTEIVRAGKRPAVVWEMVRRDQADALSRATNADAFAQNLAWEDSGWPAFALYRPIVEIAFENGLSQVAGNIRRETLGAVARKGLTVLTDDQRQKWALDPDPGEAVRSAQEDAVYEGHCRLIQREKLGPLVSAQLARDGSLADGMVVGASPDGAVLIAGSGHTDKRVGVPFYLRRLDPVATIVAVGASERDLGGGSGVGMGAYDFVYIAQPVDRPDPCEKMRQFMERKKTKE